MSKTLLQRSLPWLSIFTLLGIWQLISLFVSSQLLPPPLTVFGILWQETRSGELPFHLAMTLIRLTLAFSIAMLIGCALGILLGLNKQLDLFFDQWLVFFLNIPALVTIILCYVWFGLTEFSAVLAVIINKVPNVVVILREGTRALNKDLLEMAQSFQLGKAKTLRHVIWPQLYPYLLSSARSGLALIWKIILVVELLGRSNGMGYQLHIFFQLFDVASILAYTIAFIMVIQLVELAILKPLDRSTQRWRR